MTGPVNVYSQNAGTTPLAEPIIFAHAPGPTNVNYPLGQVVIVPSTGSAYILVSKSTSGGVVSAQWTTISTASGDIDQITATNNAGVVQPVSGNVNMTGDGSIAVTGSGDTISVGLVGLTANTVLIGQGTSTIGTVGPLTDGQLVIGSTGLPPVAANLTSSGGTLTITNGPGSINLDVVAGALTINGDSGSITGDPLTFTGGSSGAVFTGAGSTMTESFNFLSLPATTSTNGQIIINSDPVLHDFHSGGAATNIFVGAGSGNFTNTAASLTGVGHNALKAITSPTNCTAVGAQSMENFTGAGNFGNVACGQFTLQALTTGNNNTCLGDGAGAAGTTLADCTILGCNAGQNYTTTESSNIVIGSQVLGTTAESHALRIGKATGAGQGELNKAFVAGINGVSTLSPNIVTIDPASDQLGVTGLTSTGGSIAITNGTGSINLETVSAPVTIAGDFGSISGSSLTIQTGTSSQNSGSSVAFVDSGTTSTLNLTDTNSNTIIGNGSGNATLVGSGNNGLGTGVLSALTSGSTNCGFGNNCLHAVTTANANLAFGNQCLQTATTGGFNCGIGSNVLQSLTTGSGSTSVGVASLSNILTGDNNSAFGNNAGINYVGAESNNLLLGNPGTAAESNTIRIGDQGAGALQQNRCFVAGIAGVGVSNLNVVTINTSTGQLGSTGSPSVPGSLTAGTSITATAGNITATNGSLVLSTAGNKLSIMTGADASIGTSAAMVAGTVTINTTAVTASSIIFLTANTPGGVPGVLAAPQASIVAGTSFVINSSSGADTSTVNWWIVN